VLSRGLGEARTKEASACHARVVGRIFNDHDQDTSNRLRGGRPPLRRSEDCVMNRAAFNMSSLVMS
jgi:hypothetical protein